MPIFIRIEVMGLEEQTIPEPDTITADVSAQTESSSDVDATATVVETVTIYPLD